MIELDIPGFKKLEIEHLVLDYNGTLALDGKLLSGVRELLMEISTQLKIHVVTADTLGHCAEELKNLPVTIHILSAAPEDEAKLDYLARLGKESCACIGNGRNDKLMLREAALGIIIYGPECFSTESSAASDIGSTDILSALGIFTHPKRMLATLRN